MQSNHLYVRCRYVFNLVVCVNNLRKKQFDRNLIVESAPNSIFNVCMLSKFVA